MPMVYYHGRNDLDQTVEFSINGKRYHYTLTPSNRDTVEFLCRKVSLLKALAYAKRRALMTTAGT